MMSRRALEKIAGAIVSLALLNVFVVLVYLDVHQRSRTLLRGLPIRLITNDHDSQILANQDGHVQIINSNLHLQSNNVLREQQNTKRGNKHENAFGKQEDRVELSNWSKLMSQRNNHQVVLLDEMDNNTRNTDHKEHFRILNNVPLTLDKIDLLEEFILKRKIDQGASICHGSKSALAITFINSRPESLSLRKAIRSTWAKSGKRKRIVTLFVLGRSESVKVDNSILKENEKHGDILQGIFTDGFRASGIKTLMSFKWIQTFCPHTQFILIVNDVNYVNYDILLKIFQNKKNRDKSNFLLGNVVKNRAPVREPKSKYYISVKQFSRQVFPPFCTGDSGFITTSKTADIILEAAFNTTFIPIGDVFIAFLAEKNKVDIINDKRFTFRNLNHDTCLFRNIVTARGFDASRSTAQLWENMTNPEFLKNCPGVDMLTQTKRNFSNADLFDKVLRLLVDSPNLCKNDNKNPEDVFMIALISTLPMHVGNRDMIRKTWGRNREVMGMSVRLLFVMGRENEEKFQAVIKKEQLKYGDVLQADFIEDFKNLTLKVVLGLKWVSKNCPNALYMYKGDDDMFVNFENILSYILDLRTKGEALKEFYVGSVLYRSRIVRKPKSKYYVANETYSGTYFPPYCSGGGYIFSTDVIHAMYLKSLTMHLLPIDDVFQGILAEEVGVVPINHLGFKNWGDSTDKCRLMNSMTVHGIKKPDELYKVWRNFTDSSISCL